MHIIISTVQNSNLTMIQSLTSEWGYESSIAETKRWIENIQASANHQMYVASSGEQVCGWIVVEKRIDLGKGHKGEITGLVVSAQYRRYGVGRQLLSAAETWMRDHALTQAVVCSNVTRSESHDFYARSGFQHTKTSHHYEKYLGD